MYIHSNIYKSNLGVVNLESSNKKNVPTYIYNKKKKLFNKKKKWLPYILQFIIFNSST